MTPHIGIQKKVHKLKWYKIVDILMKKKLLESEKRRFFFGGPLNDFFHK